MSAVAADRHPCTVKCSDDPTMKIWRIRGALESLNALAAAGTDAAGATIALNSEHYCGLLQLIIDEVERLEDCFSAP